MAIYRAQIGWAFDSALPRDVVTINPHFFGDDPQGLANALKANLQANAQLGATQTFTVKIYDAQKPPPSFPLAEADFGTGSHPTSWPREVALCLSYYSNFNRPTYRGRLYLPMPAIGGSLGLRPTPGQMSAALVFAKVFSTALPANTNWVIYSRKRNAADGVNQIWVDDEWDTVRSRGLKGTTRQTAPFP